MLDRRKSGVGGEPEKESLISGSEWLVINPWIRELSVDLPR
jgi:hypothetical protein